MILGFYVLIQLAGAIKPKDKKEIKRNKKRRAKVLGLYI